MCSIQCTYDVYSIFTRLVNLILGKKYSCISKDWSYCGGREDMYNMQEY